MHIGERIRMIREAAGMSRKELAAEINVSYQTLATWELGGSPDMVDCGRIAAVFGLTLHELRGNAPQIRNTEMELPGLPLVE